LCITGIIIPFNFSIYQDALFASIGPDSEVHVKPKIFGSK